MQIVIDIDDSTYEAIEHEYCILPPQKGLLKVLWDVIKNGTPLPKGHGRLIDESDLIPDSDYEDGTFYAVSIGQIKRASTIIEAEKESEEV